MAVDSMTLFELPPTEQPVTISADRRRTIRHHNALADGRHPLMGGPVNLDHTCGDCAHHFAHTRNRTWHKCDLKDSNGPATDIRVSWPACTAWKPIEPVTA